jgi:hypothetical protein
MIALIADIVHSRQLEKREEIQAQLVACLKRVNQVFRSVLASNFTITLGDEFQALFKSPLRMLQALDEITFSIYPVRIRYGIGLGEITTEINPLQSIGADGPAYWNARDAIQFVHRNDDYGRSNIHVISDYGDETLPLVNELLKATSMISANWRLTQIEVIRALLEENLWTAKFDQSSLARKMNISDSTLARRMASSGIKLYLRGRGEAETALERMHSQYAK